MCQNLTNLRSGDFVFLAGRGGGRGKNMPDPIVCQFVCIFFIFRKNQNKTKKQQVIGWFDCIQVWRVYTQENYLYLYDWLNCTLHTLVVAWLCDLAF